MIIRGVVHNVIGDAPFIGANIIAMDCYKNCHGCHNQHLKEREKIETSWQEVIDEVRSNPFNQGIILGGLEWTYFPDWMTELVNGALQNNLEVMIYTYMEEEEFSEKFPNLISLPIYIKFGEYDSSKETHNNFHYGVKLATSNQYIKKFG